MILEAIDLSKTYEGGEMPVQALRSANLELERGDFVALMGPSGCGKSSLLHLCGAMDRPTSGRIVIEGTPLHGMDDLGLTRLRRTRIGFVFQFFNLLPTLTVAENVALPLLLAGVSKSKAEADAGRWIDRVGLASRRGHYPQQLSGGEMQRTALARAVAHQPALLLADEPTGNLDSANSLRVLALLRELNDETGVAVLLATHSAEIAAGAKRLLHMRDGRISNE
ncbi:MAG TPA: ABC transporter ATP-binding protein [Terriglobia bacterium]|nr:ABC transporter ATP-binding protein [Terriglobia bacterium]